MQIPEIGMIDVDKQSDIAAKYGVMSIPTLLIIDDKDRVDTQIEGSKIGKWLKENFKK